MMTEQELHEDTLKTEFDLSDRQCRLIASYICGYCNTQEAEFRKAKAVIQRIKDMEKICDPEYGDIWRLCNNYLISNPT